MFSNDGTVIFDNVHHRDTNFHTLGWSEATKADFTKFTRWRLFTLEGQANLATHNYTLDDVEIIRAFERGFEMPDPNVPSQAVYDLRNSNFTGITNINNIIENSTQYIENATALDDDFKSTFTQLLSKLEAAIAQIPAEYQNEARTLAKQTQRLAEDVAEPEPDKAGVQITAEGLKKAAENLVKVAPHVLPVALELVRHVMALGAG
jgi:hypothetical protein